jgi:para-aminobenzoate synthetase component I
MPLVEELTSLPDAADCCDRLRGLPYLLFLDSAARGTRLGRFSFLTGDPALVVRSKGPRTRVIDRIAGTQHDTNEDALAVVRSLVAPHHADAIADAPPFQAGAAGYLGYDWGLTLERLPAPRFDDLAMDDVVIGIYDWVISWDHEAKRAWLISTGLPETDPGAKTRRARDRGAAVRHWLEGRPEGRPLRLRDLTTPGRDSGFGIRWFKVCKRAERRGNP